MPKHALAHLDTELLKKATATALTKVTRNLEDCDKFARAYKALASTIRNT